MKNLTAGQQAVLYILQGLKRATDEQLVDTYGSVWCSLNLPAQTPSSIRSRRAELVRRGKVAACDFKRTMSTGNYGSVWTVA